MVEKLIEVVANLIQEQPSELVSALKGDNGEWRDDADAILNERLLTDRKSFGEQQLKRGVRTKGTEYDRYIRSAFGDLELPNDARDTALIDALSERMKAKPAAATPESTPAGTVDPKAMLSTPEGQKVLNQLVQEATAKEREEKKALADQFTQYKRDNELSKVGSVVRNQVLKAAERLGIPITVPGNKELSDQRLETIMYRPEFHPSKWKIGEDGVALPVDEHGEFVYNQKTMQQLDMDGILTKANPYGVNVYDSQAKDTPAPTGGKESSAPVKFNIKTPQEYMELRKKFEHDKAKLKEVNDSWMNRAK